MKIAFVIYSFEGGGAERVVSNLSLEFAKEHDISIILFDTSEIAYPYKGKIIDLKLPSAKSGGLGKIVQLLRRAISLRRVFKKHQFDVIFTHMETANFPAILVSKDIIASVHDDPNSFTKMYRFLIPKLYPRAKKVITVSGQIEAKLNAGYHVHNTATIYNTVDIEYAQKQSKEHIEHDKPFILAVGRLGEQKGFDMLIEAYAQTKAKNTTDLIILGEGELRSELEALVEKYDLQGKVHLKGRVDNPFAYYSKAKFFVLSSRHEGFPNILIEALACDCACIAFDCPTGPNEIIQPGKSGLLVEPENIEALGVSIDELHSDEVLLATFRKNASASVEHLSPSKIAHEWMKLIASTNKQS